MDIKLATAGLLVIMDRKLLLAFSNNKQCFYLPGGKINHGENSAQALCREIEEELNVSLQPEDLTYYTHISAPAYGEQTGIVMEQDCFMLHKPIDAVASAEIAELKYFSVKEYGEETRQAPGAVLILNLLQKENLID